MKLHLVDGTYELFRAFYGAPPALSTTGAEVGATRGLLRSLLSLLGEPGVTHVAVAFDTVIESFRNAILPTYKTGDGVDPLLLAQFPLAEHAAEALGLVTWRMRDFEADDAIATAVARFGREANINQVVICSVDKDFAQCVRGADVVLWDRRRQLLTDEAGVVQKFGVGPASIADWLGLVGDTADGIPGVPRWGAKSAGAVLAQYQHIESIPDDVSFWTVRPRGAAALASSLATHRQAALLYRQVATLRTDVPLEENLEALRWPGASKALLLPLCEALGETRLLEGAVRWR